MFFHIFDAADGVSGSGRSASESSRLRDINDGGVNSPFFYWSVVHILISGFLAYFGAAKLTFFQISNADDGASGSGRSASASSQLMNINDGEVNSPFFIVPLSTS